MAFRDSDTCADLSRRRFLRTGLMAASCVALSPLLSGVARAATAIAPARSLALTNLHTGEACAVTYWEQGSYLPQSLAVIQRVLRDHRNGEEHPIDPDLLDLLYALHGRLDTNQPFEVISGYRSPESNASMHARSSGVATKSLHMLGKAIDIRVPGRELALVQSTAQAMGVGGVGYYPTSGFVHVDTGRVRQWQGS